MKKMLYISLCLCFIQQLFGSATDDLEKEFVLVESEPLVSKWPIPILIQNSSESYDIELSYKQDGKQIKKILQRNITSNRETSKIELQANKIEPIITFKAVPKTGLVTLPTSTYNFLDKDFLERERVKEENKKLDELYNNLVEGKSIDSHNARYYKGGWLLKLYFPSNFSWTLNGELSWEDRKIYKSDLLEFIENKAAATKKSANTSTPFDDSMKPEQFAAIKMQKKVLIDRIAFDQKRIDKLSKLVDTFSQYAKIMSTDKNLKNFSQAEQDGIAQIKKAFKLTQEHIAKLLNRYSKRSTPPRRSVLLKWVSQLLNEWEVLLNRTHGNPILKELKALKKEWSSTPSIKN